MKQDNYKELYDRVGKLIGWDFSKVKVTSEGEEWDFFTEVRRLCNKSYFLLDIGTGGGEKVMKVAPYVSLVVGIDKADEMIKTANKNLRKLQLPNARFFQMDAKEIKFPDAFFDIVSCRHSNFFPEEVARVMTENGVFLTQQVSEADKINIKQAFNRGQSFRAKDGTAKANYIRELRKAGFSDIKTFDYDAKEWYKTPEDLIFVLRNTPIIPDFGRPPKDWETLSEFISRNTSDEGIITNSKRYLIIAKKHSDYPPAREAAIYKKDDDNDPLFGL